MPRTGQGNQRVVLRFLVDPTAPRTGIPQPGPTPVIGVRNTRQVPTLPRPPFNRRGRDPGPSSYHEHVVWPVAEDTRFRQVLSASRPDFGMAAQPSGLRRNCSGQCPKVSLIHRCNCRRRQRSGGLNRPRRGRDPAPAGLAPMPTARHEYPAGARSRRHYATSPRSSRWSLDRPEGT
jgi:hypothetical protein